MQELEALENERVSYERLKKTLADLASFALLEDLKPEDAEELEKECALVEKALSEWELKTLLGGEYDA